MAAILVRELVQVMSEEGLSALGFVPEQMDLPLLVRTDTRAFVRASDFEIDGAADVFNVFDRATKQVQKASKTSLALGTLDPALEGGIVIDTLHGKVTVTGHYLWAIAEEGVET